MKPVSDIVADLNSRILHHLRAGGKYPMLNLSWQEWAVVCQDDYVTSMEKGATPELLKAAADEQIIIAAGERRVIVCYDRNFAPL